MMDTIKILVVGKHPEIMQTILRLINSKPEWQASVAFSAAEAITQCELNACSLVLIGAGLAPEESDELQQYLTAHKPEIKFTQHYGGGSGLLYAEIFEALG